MCLPEAPATGFKWEIEHSDANVLELLKSDYTPPTDSAAGGTGVRSWALRAKAAGTVLLSAKRWRAWEGEQSIVERFEITIRVVP
jgi:predicted secreted protein